MKNREIEYEEARRMKLEILRELMTRFPDTPYGIQARLSYYHSLYWKRVIDKKAFYDSLYSMCMRYPYSSTIYYGMLKTKHLLELREKIKGKAPRYAEVIDLIIEGRERKRR